MKQKDFQKYPLKLYSPLKELIPYIRPYSCSLLKTFIALCGAAFSILAIGPSLRFLIDNGFQTENPEFLNKAVLILITLSLVLAFSAYIRLSSTSWLAEQIVTDLRKDLFAHLLRLDASFFDRARLGDLIARLSDDCTLLKTLLSSSGAIVIRGFIQFVGASILMIFTSLKLTFFMFLIIPLAFFPIWLLGNRLKRKTLEVQNAQGSLTAFSEERLAGITTIQAFNQEESTLNQFTTLNTVCLKMSRKNLRMRALLIALVIGSVFIAISIILSVGGHSVLSKSLSPGIFISFLLYTLIAAGSLNEIAEVLGDFQKASGAMNRVLEILKTSSKVNDSLFSLTPKHLFRTHLRLKNVSFAYPARPQVSALENFSIDIKNGEKIALVGPSGAGKSTLFKLLLRFYDAQEGKIFIDKHEATKLSLQALRQTFSLVTQETTIFHDTLYQNIVFARPNATYQEVMEAAEAAYVNEFVHSLPQGFNTLVGDHGKQLSGGQRQRIAIARALLKNAPILLLDEATNALDPQSEFLIQQAISHLVKDRTTLIIAHHLTTIQNCERVLVMDKGRLVQEGTHQALIKEDGLYKQLYDKQFNPRKN
jgi:ATP-binding cassette subfamily B protein